jgi:hypothetical protein
MTISVRPTLNAIGTDASLERTAASSTVIVELLIALVGVTVTAATVFVTVAA